MGLGPEMAEMAVMATVIGAVQIFACLSVAKQYQTLVADVQCLCEAELGYLGQ